MQKSSTPPRRRWASATFAWQTRRMVCLCIAIRCISAVVTSVHLKSGRSASAVPSVIRRLRMCQNCLCIRFWSKNSNDGSADNEIWVQTRALHVSEKRDETHFKTEHRRSTENSTVMWGIVNQLLQTTEFHWNTEIKF